MEREMIDVGEETFEVISDGKTCWVNNNQFLMGRFGKNGYEYHFEDGSHCLVWNGNTYNFSSWNIFTGWFATYHSFKIDSKHLPRQIRLKKDE